MVSGRVLDSQNNAVGGATVSIQIGDPPQSYDLVYSDNSGAYQDTFIIPANFRPGQYTIYVTASKAGFTISPPQQTQFTLVQQNTSTTSSSSSSSSSASSQSNGLPSPCFIATATYGSEIAPEVALLRHFRDAQVLQTSAGRSFMQAFNDFYYSFSPQVAAFISSHAVLRSAMKVLLYPLIGILYLSSRMFQASSFNEELAVVISGTFAALGIGVVYFGPIAIICSRMVKRNVRSRWPNAKWVIFGSCLISTFGIAVGEVSQSPVFLTAATVAAVLSFVLLGALSVRTFASLLITSEKKAR